MRRKIFKFTLFIIFIILLNGCIPPKDTILPQISIIYPINEQKVSGTIIIHIQASDNVEVVKIEIFIDGNKVAEDKQSQYEYSWNTDNLQYNSQHIIFAKAYDNAGNVGISNTVVVNIGDTQAPQVVIINPQNGQAVSGSVIIQVSVVEKVIPNKKIISKFPSGIDKVEFYVDESKIGEDSQTPYEYSWNTTTVLNGNHTIMAKVYDKAENTGTASIEVEVSNPWQKTYGGSSLEEATSIQQTIDGGYIAAGYTTSFGGGFDFYIIKLNSYGNKVWEKTFGGSNIDCAYSIQQTTDGGYIIAGSTSSFGVGNYDFYIIKTDSEGNTAPYPPIQGAPNLLKK
ncbi:MAG: Ig-like domain-containing protein [Dictyoglomaceae bacterium]|nr:Ig-like domain-containing protein [Dictyoglomaceae bacterium]